MKLKLLMAGLALLTLFQCASSGPDHRTKQINACAVLCKGNPSVKGVSFEHGGGSLFILGGGYVKESCNCK